MISPGSTRHYTPEPLATQVVEAGILPLLAAGLRPEYKHIRVWDPACGDGALLVAASRYLPLECLYGSDVDEAALDVARARLPDVWFSNCDAIFGEPEFPWAYERVPNCIVANPPYLGGGKISGAIGAEYTVRLKKKYGSVGHADLASLVLRASAERCEGGTPETIGFVATNTIAQGDTRLMFLRQAIDYEGWDVRYATESAPWPGVANVSVRVVSMSRGLPRTNDSQLQSWLRKVPNSNR